MALKAGIAARVVAVDINPRATRFGRFNAHFNHLADKITFLVAFYSLLTTIDLIHACIHVPL
jgi:methylase of polypeptide subunit release factors